jgi:hypothetical protein
MRMEKPNCPSLSLAVLAFGMFGTSVHAAAAMLIVARRYIRHPKPFKCTIRPRSESAIKLVKEACERTSY